MKMIDLIKQAGTQAVEAGNPVNVLYGEVTRTTPLEVNVDQRFTLSSGFLLVPESLVHFEIQLGHSHTYSDESGTETSMRTTGSALPEAPIVIRRGLEVGDKVLLLRVQGGQRFVILDRVVET